MTFDPQIVEIEPVHLAIIREQIPLEEIGTLFDRAFRTMPERVAAQGRQLTGAAYGLTFSRPTDMIDIAAGFPVDAPIDPEGDMVPFTTPGGTAARYEHRGAYDGLSEAYGQLFAWLEREGLAPGPVMWEIYVTEPSPEADPADMITEITIPLA